MTSPITGPSGLRPRVGLRPTRPQHEAGTRIEPPPSLACASGTIPAATAAAESVAGPGTVTVEAEGDAVWVTVRIAPARAADVNRALAGAGIYASRLEAGTDLESLFLELTGGDVAPGGRSLGDVA